MTLKEKTINGLVWSFIDNFANQGIQFVVGIVLARLLSPQEFGLIGMLTIFIAVSQSFIDSGFSNALIRKKDCTNEDYSTVFYFNLSIGIIFYFLLFISAQAISVFFKEPQLKLLLQILGLSLIINSLTIIQRTILIKRINFKLQTRISVISALLSGGISITMALKGYGVWSLVAKTILGYAITSLLLWLWNKWNPIHVFSKKSFKELFGFGSKLLISGLIDTIYRNVYYLVIGKYFSAQELGYYTRADQFKTLPSQNISDVMTRVTYPVLSQLQDEPEKLKTAYKKMIKSIMLISFALMIGMCAVAEPLVITLVGIKWQPSVIYLQLLCFGGMLYPLHALNLNMLQVQGRSDLFLKLEIIKKILAIPTIIIGVFLGIKFMIMGMIVNSIIAYYLNSYWSGKFINYSTKEQIIDILPTFLISLFMGICVYLLGIILHCNHWIILFCQLCLGTVLMFSLCRILKIDAYLELNAIVIEQLKKNKNGNKQ